MPGVSADGSALYDSPHPYYELHGNMHLRRHQSLNSHFSQEGITQMAGPSVSGGMPQGLDYGIGVSNAPASPSTSLRVPRLSMHSDCAEGTLGSPGIPELGGFHKFLPSNNEDEENWGEKGDVYASDEFRMYEYKVRRCMRGRSHDWTECPFAHPGEKARRRDPRRYHYSGTACPDFRKGTCRRGDACEYAHGVFECWLHPARYRTQPCKDGRNCRRRVCFFAHTSEQLHLQPAAAAAAARSSQCPTGVSSPTSTLVRQPSSPPMSPSLSPEFSPPRSPRQHMPHFPSSPQSQATWSTQQVAAAMRQRQLERMNSLPSLPSLHIPSSAEMPLLPPQSPAQHHRRAVLHSSLQDSYSPVSSMSSPASTPSSNTGGSRSNNISELLASLQTLDIRRQNQIVMQAQAHVQAAQAQAQAHAHQAQAQAQAAAQAHAHSQAVAQLMLQQQQQQRPQAVSHRMAASAAASHLQPLRSAHSMPSSVSKMRWEKEQYQQQFEKRWDADAEAAEVAAASGVQRVESGRDIRSKIYGGVGASDAVESWEAPDVDWVSDLVKEEPRSMEQSRSYCGNNSWQATNLAA